LLNNWWKNELIYVWNKNDDCPHRGPHQHQFFLYGLENSLGPSRIMDWINHRCHVHWSSKSNKTLRPLRNPCFHQSWHNYSQKAHNKWILNVYCLKRFHIFVIWHLPSRRCQNKFPSSLRRRRYHQRLPWQILFSSRGQLHNWLSHLFECHFHRC